MMTDNLFEKVIVVVLAGGGGRRLWPISTDANPKPLCSFSQDGKTMLQKALDRTQKIVSADKIFISTNGEVAEKIMAKIPGIGAENVITEPATKDTAAAIGLCAIMLGQRQPDAIMVVLTADHVIPEESKFLDKIKEAVCVAQSGPYLVTLGITPTRASSEYGYIKTGPKLPIGEATLEGLNFEEKPNEQTALGFLKEGTYLWNSGMFIWQIDTILAAIKKYMPELHAGLEEIKEALHSAQSTQVINKVFGGLDKVSIDHGLMQKIKPGGELRIAVIKADFDWSDLGNWNAMIMPADKKGNICWGEGESSVKNSTNCVIHNAGEQKSFLLGLNDLVVVNSKLSTLVVPRKRAADVKQLVHELNGDRDLKKYVEGDIPQVARPLAGKCKSRDTENSIVFSDDGLVATIGVADLIVARFRKNVVVAAKRYLPDLKDFLSEEELAYITGLGT
ncbi:MAG: mannose-1-phosphate guanylyltransferase [Candidatus Omnitrophica bacterium]|nr:mannose-1-phosphate guanylyltransferase [Candidatus Omnitrophota bacterium]